MSCRAVLAVAFAIVCAVASEAPIADEKGACDVDGHCEEDASSLIQHARAADRGLLARREKDPAKVAVLTTPGGKELCCGKPSKDADGNTVCSSERGKTRNMQMAQGVKDGALTVCPDCQVDIFDINAENESCPDARLLSKYDAIVVGAPTYGGAPSPDMMTYLVKYWRPYKSMPCKVGAAFITGSDYFGGIADAMNVLRNYMLAYRFLVVGSSMAGGAGEFLTGAGAGLGGLHYASGSGEPPVHQEFINEAKALGANVANVSSFVKGVYGVCGQTGPDGERPDFLTGFTDGVSPGFNR
jgi:multimeric flavodoxin WrbA